MGMKPDCPKVICHGKQKRMRKMLENNQCKKKNSASQVKKTYAPELTGALLTGVLDGVKQGHRVYADHCMAGVAPNMHDRHSVKQIYGNVKEDEAIMKTTFNIFQAPVRL